MYTFIYVYNVYSMVTCTITIVNPMFIRTIRLVVVVVVVVPRCYYNVVYSIIFTCV